MLPFCVSKEVCLSYLQSQQTCDFLPRAAFYNKKVRLIKSNCSGKYASNAPVPPLPYQEATWCSVARKFGVQVIVLLRTQAWEL